MADVFISYSKADRNTAKLLADRFEERGWDVWWDPEIGIGEQFDRRIEDELKNAVAIVVLWSKHSVDSRWVRSEAKQGVDRDVLVPGRIGRNVAIPVAFGTIQTAELADWAGEVAHAEFKRMLDSLEKIIGQARSRAGVADTSPQPVPGSGSPSLPPGRPRPEDVSRRKSLKAFALLAAPTIIALLIAVGASQWHRPTPFKLALTLDAVEFESGAPFDTLLVDKTPLIRFTMDGLDHARVLSTQIAEFASRQPKEAGIELKPAQAGGAEFGEMSRLVVKPGERVRFAVVPGSTGELAIEFPKSPKRVVVSLRAAVNMDLKNLLSGDATAAAGPENPLSRVIEIPVDAKIDLTSLDGGTMLAITPVLDASKTLALPTDLLVSKLSFLKKRENEIDTTTIVGAGKIGYDGVPSSIEIGVSAGEHLRMEGLERFFIRSLKFDQVKHQLHLEAGGTVKKLEFGGAGALRERTQTYLDAAMHSPLSTQLFALAVWLFPTTVAGWKLARKLRQ